MLLSNYLPTAPINPTEPTLCTLRPICLSQGVAEHVHPRRHQQGPRRRPAHRVGAVRGGVTGVHARQRVGTRGAITCFVLRCAVVYWQCAYAVGQYVVESGESMQVNG